MTMFYKRRISGLTKQARYEPIFPLSSVIYLDHRSEQTHFFDDIIDA